MGELIHLVELADLFLFLSLATIYVILWKIWGKQTTPPQPEAPAEVKPPAEPSHIVYHHPLAHHSKIHPESK